MRRELNDIDEKIIQLYKMGLPTTEIGHRVGKTKGSVCGLLFRYREGGHLGTKRYTGPLIIGPKKTRRRAERKPSILPLFTAMGRASLPQPIVVPTKPETNGITFWKLKRSSCRYVINDGRPENFLFCGEPIHNRAYCAYHASVCYTQPQPKTSTPNKFNRVK